MRVESVVVDKSRTHGHQRTKLKYAFHLSIVANTVYLSNVHTIECVCVCVCVVECIPLQIVVYVMHRGEQLSVGSQLAWLGLNLRAHVLAIISNAFPSHWLAECAHMVNGFWFGIVIGSSFKFVHTEQWTPSGALMHSVRLKILIKYSHRTFNDWNIVTRCHWRLKAYAISSDGSVTLLLHTNDFRCGHRCHCKSDNATNISDPMWMESGCVKCLRVY